MGNMAGTEVDQQPPPVTSLSKESASQADPAGTVIDQQSAVTNFTVGREPTSSSSQADPKDTTSSEERGGRRRKKKRRRSPSTSSLSNESSRYDLFVTSTF